MEVGSSEAIGGHGQMDGCVCTYIWNSFVLSQLALIVKTTISVISWLASQGKKNLGLCCSWKRGCHNVAPPLD